MAEEITRPPEPTNLLGGGPQLEPFYEDRRTPAEKELAAEDAIGRALSALRFDRYQEAVDILEGTIKRDVEADSEKKELRDVLSRLRWLHRWSTRYGLQQERKVHLRALEAIDKTLELEDG